MPHLPDRLKEYQKLPIDVVLDKLGSSKVGLKHIEVTHRLTKYGPNIFWSKQSFDIKRFIKEEILNYFNLILIAVSLISFFGAGDRVESSLILGFLLLSITLSFVSELQFQHLYSKLLDYIQKKVEVIREKKTLVVMAQDLVPGDIIYLTKGEKVPADCQVITSLGLTIDESALTGESAVVIKGPDDRSLYAGTSVSDGEGEAVVVFTGKETIFAGIGKLALSTEKKSAYQKELDKFSKYLIRIVLSFVTVVFTFNYLYKGLNIQELLSFSLVLGISIIPELLPPIAALALAISSHFFARKKTIIKRLSAIEDLGLIDVLCVDKTGTITTNELKLEEVDAQKPDQLVYYALSSAWGISQKYLSDFEKALEELLEKPTGIAIKKQLEQTKLIDRKLFDPNLRFSEAIIDNGKAQTLVVTGAPESILRFSNLTAPATKKWHEKISRYSHAGFRVYGVATHHFGKEPTNFLAKHLTPNHLTFLGVAVFRDSVKPNVREAIATAESLGVLVKILTGDRVEVAEHVAREVGLLGDNEPAFSEEQLEKLSESEFREVVWHHKVFARVRPEMKYRIVQALQHQFQVGYLGEGINDLPVIRLANIGMVVDSAIDSSKEIADVIILEKDLRVIIDGILLGRKVFFNILKYLRHTMSDNFGNFFSIGILSIFLPFLPLTPIQILLTDFLTDLPLFGVSLDRVDAKEIRQPSHYRMMELFLLLCALGIVAAGFNLFIYWLFRGHGQEVIRTVIFLQSTFSGLIVFYSIRSNDWFFKSGPARIMNLLTLASLLVTILLIYSPVNHYFNMTSIPVGTLVFLLIYNVGYLATNDVMKMTVLKFLNKQTAETQAESLIRS